MEELTHEEAKTLRGEIDLAIADWRSTHTAITVFAWGFSLAGMLFTGLIGMKLNIFNPGFWLIVGVWITYWRVSKGARKQFWLHWEQKFNNLSDYYRRNSLNGASSELYRNMPDGPFDI